MNRRAPDGAAEGVAAGAEVADGVGGGIDRADGSSGLEVTPALSRDLKVWQRAFMSRSR